MSLNSINTNINAQVALQSLNVTSSQLAAAQKQISTGYRVADATDNGAAYAVAQAVRADVAGLTSANAQLGNVQGLVGVTNTAIDAVSSAFKDINTQLVALASGAQSATQRAEYKQTLTSDLTEVKNYINQATYNGKSLVGGTTTTPASGLSFTIDEAGSSHGVASFGGAITTTISAFLTSVAGLSSVATSTATQAYLTKTGTFNNLLTEIGKVQNYYGGVTNFLNAQITYNSDKIDSLNAGLGALVDANLAQESAQLQSLQIRQQLGTQALSIANQSPSSLLSLFK